MDSDREATEKLVYEEEKSNNLNDKNANENWKIVRSF